MYLEPELIVGHNLWPVTHDPVLDHDMSRSRLLTNHDEFTTIAFSSLQLYAIWNSGYGLCSEYLYSIYSKSSSLHYIHVDLRQFLQAEHGEQFLVFWFNLLHGYISSNHGSSVLRHWPVTHVTHSHSLTHLSHDPWPTAMSALPRADYPVGP